MKEIFLHQSLSAYGGSDFLKTIRSELNNLKRECLKLEKCLMHSNYVLDTPFDIVLLHDEETRDEIVLKLGIFFEGINTGNCCADDPSTIESQNEYCELLILLSRQNAQAKICLLDD